MELCQQALTSSLSFERGAETMNDTDVLVVGAGPHRAHRLPLR